MPTRDNEADLLTKPVQTSAEKGLLASISNMGYQYWSQWSGFHRQLSLLHVERRLERSDLAATAAIGRGGVRREAFRLSVSHSGQDVPVHSNVYRHSGSRENALENVR
eukprot:589295-Amphidinium_carterae.3